MEIPEKVQKHAAWLPWFSGAKRKPRPPHIAPSLWPSSAWEYSTMECSGCQRSLCERTELGRIALCFIDYSNCSRREWSRPPPRRPKILRSIFRTRDAFGLTLAKSLRRRRFNSRLRRFDAYGWRMRRRSHVGSHGLVVLPLR